MAKYIISTTAEDLAKDMIEDLDRGERTQNGDRVSTYFELAHTEERDPNGDDSVTVSLIEFVNGLDGDAPYYGLHIIDDVTGADCELRYTEEPTEAALVALLKEIIADLS